jgi:hypothetical protein
VSVGFQGQKRTRTCWHEQREEDQWWRDDRRVGGTHLWTTFLSVTAKNDTTGRR